MSGPRGPKLAQTQPSLQPQQQQYSQPPPPQYYQPPPMQYAQPAQSFQLSHPPQTYQQAPAVASRVAVGAAQGWLWRRTWRKEEGKGSRLRNDTSPASDRTTGEPSDW